MPRIIGELGGLSIMTWVTTAYMLTSTTVVPIAGNGPERRGVATSATQFFRSIGGTLGMTVLGSIFNIYSNSVIKQEFFPLIQNISSLKVGLLSDIITQGQSDPHSLFNILLSPETIHMIPEDLQ
ncbi:MAG: hypothetical protein H7X79_09050 [Sporomusaceae bacterium]|nr:hypothetical protein [Sporomusaceae bacterium]